MTFSRSSLLVPAALFALTLQPAANIAADAPASLGAAPSHHGQAFAASKGAQPRIVEPDGRVVTTDGWPDLVAPASIAQRQIKNAIVQLIRPAKAGAAASPGNSDKAGANASRYRQPTV
jgi:hypothetical protein